MPPAASATTIRATAGSARAIAVALVMMGSLEAAVVMMGSFISRAAVVAVREPAFLAVLPVAVTTALSQALPAAGTTALTLAALPTGAAAVDTVHDASFHARSLVHIHGHQLARIVAGERP